jgi:limonene-1,2-epoxide hydrolase
MTRRLSSLAALALAAVLLAAGCGGRSGSASGSPEEVVRAWSAALNAGDNEAAADLFAPDAVVIQGSYSATLATKEDAVGFNASLPCSGQIVELTVERDQVTATFLLGDRPQSRCDGPGQQATAIFVVQDGKIVVWQQVPAPAGGAPAGTGAGPTA